MRANKPSFHNGGDDGPDIRNERAFQPSRKIAQASAAIGGNDGGAKTAHNFEADRSTRARERAADLMSHLWAVAMLHI